MPSYGEAIAAAATRDHFTCQRCGRRGCDVAHVLPKGRFPELRCELKNLITLCRNCHERTENVKGRRELLGLLRKKHGYTYEEGEYDGYRSEIEGP